MDNNLRLQVIFDGLDKLSGPIKKMMAGSKGLASSVAQAKQEVAKLTREQAKIGKLTAMQSGLSENHKKLDEVRRKMRELRMEMSQTSLPSTKLKTDLKQLGYEEKRLSKDTLGQAKALQTLQSELKEAGVDVDRLGDHQQKLARTIDDANKKLSQQSSRLERVNKIQRRAGKFRDFAAGAGSRATIGLTAPLGYFGVASFKAAMDAEELQSAFNVTFGQMAGDMNRWAEATGNAMGRATTEMQQGANTFGMFFNEAANPKKAAEMSQTFAVLAQDLASFFNTDTQTAIDKLRSGLSGESEPLRDFGVFLTEAAVKAKAMKLGLTGVGNELTEQEKILARYALILDGTSKAQGDVARTSNSTANRLRATQGAWTELQITVGQKLIPQLLPLITKLASLIEGFNNLSPSMKQFIIYGGMAAAVLGPLLIGIAGLASSLVVLAPIIAAIGAPVLFVVALVIGALVGLGLIIYKYWDQIKSAFIGGFNFIASLSSRMQAMGGNLIMGLVLGIMSGAGKVWNALRSIVIGGINKVKAMLGIKSPSRVFMALGGYTSEGMALGISKGRGRAITAAGRLASGVVAAGALSLAPATAGTLQRSAGGVGAAIASAPTYNISITVNGAAGQDAKAIADQVMLQLEKVAGVKARSSYSDGE